MVELSSSPSTILLLSMPAFIILDWSISISNYGCVVAQAKSTSSTILLRLRFRTVEEAKWESKYVCRNESEFICLSRFVSNLDAERGSTCDSKRRNSYFIAFEDVERFLKAVEERIFSVGMHMFFLSLPPTDHLLIYGK